MKKYVDFDGVIFDTESIIFDDNYYMMKTNPDFDKEKYVQNINWYEVLLKSEQINNSIEILKELKNDIIILTKTNSLNNEATAKIRILRELNIKSDVILVPFYLKKTDVVSAKDNLLIDNTVHNLEEWELDGGIPIFFNKDNEDYDNWDVKNTKYKKIKSLDYLKTL